MHCFRSALLLLVLVVAQGSNSSNSSNLTTTPAPTATTTTVPTKTLSGKIVIGNVSQAMCDWAKNLSEANKTAILQQLVPNITQVTSVTIGCASRRLREQRNRKLTADKKLEIKFVAVVPTSTTTITVTAALLTQLRTLLKTLGANQTEVDALTVGSFDIVLDSTDTTDSTNKASTFCMHGLLIACLGLLAGVHLV